MKSSPEKPEEKESPPKDLSRLKELVKEKWRLNALLKEAKEAQGH